jgi:predicted RNase H-like HicB family nuclease
MRRKKQYFYPAVFTYEDDNEVAVVFPDLNAATSGINDDDALRSARECLSCVLSGLEEEKEPIPDPTPIGSVKKKKNERVVLVNTYMLSNCSTDAT